MTVSQPPVKVADLDNYFSNSEKFWEVFPVSIKDGSDLISLIIAGKDAPLPQAHPKLVNDELIPKISATNSSTKFAYRALRCILRLVRLQYCSASTVMENMQLMERRAPPIKGKSDYKSSANHLTIRDDR